MDGYCFNCSQESVGQYTVVSDPLDDLEERLTCDDCLSELQETDGVEVYQSPVIVRRGGSTSEERASSHGTPETDDLLKTLAHPIRREVIHYFESRGGEGSAALDELVSHIERRMPAKDHDQLRAALYQVHLPMLHSRGWVVFDTETASVTYEGHQGARRLLSEVTDIFGA